MFTTSELIWKNVFPFPIRRNNLFWKKENFGETFSQAMFLNAHKTDQLKHDHSQDFVIQSKPSLTDVS